MATSPVSLTGAAGSTPRGAVWELLLQGRSNLKPTDVQQVCDRFRNLRGDEDVTLSDALLTPEELANVLGVDYDAAAVYPLFNLLLTDANSSEGSRCDLRVLLVAMAGLTRKKAVDRMRFAALLLDESETGYLTDEQLALVLHANSLLDTTRADGAGPALQSTFAAKARELAGGAAENPGSLRVSHENFLELVRRSPQELGIPPDRKRARGAASSVASACTTPRSPVSIPAEAEAASSSAASTPSPSKLKLAGAAAAARLRPQDTSRTLSYPKPAASEASPATSSSASPSKLQQAAADAAARLLPSPSPAVENTSVDADRSRSASPASSTLQHVAATAAARLSAVGRLESTSGDASPATVATPSPSKLEEAAAAAAARLLPPPSAMNSTAAASSSGIAPLPSVDALLKAAVQSNSIDDSAADVTAPSVTTAWGTEEPDHLRTAAVVSTSPEAAPEAGASAAEPDAAEADAKPEQVSKPTEELPPPRHWRELEAASARSTSRTRTSARSSSQPRTGGTPPPRSASCSHTSPASPEGQQSRSASRPRTPQEMSGLAAAVSARAAEKAVPLSPATAAHPDLRMAPLASALSGGDRVATPPLTPKAPHTATLTLPAPSLPIETRQAVSPIPAWRCEDLSPGNATPGRAPTPPRTASRGGTPRSASRSVTPRSASRRGTPRTGVSAAADFRRLPLAPGAAHGSEADLPAPPLVSDSWLPGPPSGPHLAGTASVAPSTREGVTPIPAKRASMGWTTQTSNRMAADATPETAVRMRARPGTPQVVQEFGTPTPREDNATPRGFDDGEAKQRTVLSVPQDESECPDEGLRAAAAQSLQIPAPPAPLVGALRAAGGFQQCLPAQPDTGHSNLAEHAEARSNSSFPPLPQCRPLALPPGLPSSLGPPPAAPSRAPLPPPAAFGAPPPPPSVLRPPPPHASASEKALPLQTEMELPGTPRHADSEAQPQPAPPRPPSADSYITRPSDFDSAMLLRSLASKSSEQELPESTAQEFRVDAEHVGQDLRTAAAAQGTTAWLQPSLSLGPGLSSSSRPPTPRAPPPTSPRKPLTPPPLPMDTRSSVEQSSQDLDTESGSSQPSKQPTPTCSPRMPLHNREPWSDIKCATEGLNSAAAMQTFQPAPSSEVALGQGQDLSSSKPPTPRTPPPVSLQKPPTPPPLPTQTGAGVEGLMEGLRGAAAPGALASPPLVDLPGTPRHSAVAGQDLSTDEVITVVRSSLQKPPTPPLSTETGADAECLSEDLRGAAASGSLAPPPFVGEAPSSSSRPPTPRALSQSTQPATSPEFSKDALCAADCASEDLRAAALGSMPLPPSEDKPPSTFSRPPTPRSPPPNLLRRRPTPPPLPSEPLARLEDTSDCLEPQSDLPCQPGPLAPTTSSPRMPLLSREPWANMDQPTEDLRGAASTGSQSLPVQPSAPERSEASDSQTPAAVEAELPGTPRHPSESESKDRVHQKLANADKPSGVDDVQIAPPHQQVAHRSGRSERSGPRLFTPRSGRSVGSGRSAPKSLQVPEAPTSMSARLANFMRGAASVHPAEDIEVQSVKTAQPLPPSSTQLPPPPSLQPAPSGETAQVEAAHERQEASVSPQDELQELSVSAHASSAASPDAKQSEESAVPRGAQRLTGPGCPSRIQKRPAHVPLLDFSRVMRIIDGEPQALEAETQLPDDLESPGGSSASGSAGGLESPGTPRIATEAAENELKEGLEFYFVGSEAGSSSPSSKAASLNSSWREGATAADEKKKDEDDLELGLGDQPDWGDWTYGRYVMEQHRRTMLKWVSCGPMRAGQRRLLVVALVLLQIALLLFVLDAGGIGGATASAVGYRIREAQIALAIFAAVAAVVTLCFCAGLWDNISGDAREVGLGGLALGEEASETTPALRAGRGIAVRAAGHESRYKELLRRMKEQNAPAKVEEPTQDLLDTAAQEPLGSQAVSADDVAVFPTRAPLHASPEKEQPRSWPGPDRRRYLQLKGGDEEAMVASGPALRAVGARGLRMPSRRLPMGVGSGRALRVAPRGVASAGAGAEELEGWS